MTAHLSPRPDEHIADVTNVLAAEFRGALSSALVTAVVLDARRDLEGRVVPEAVAEMLHRLARHRLNVMCAGNAGWA